jgi:succinyl-diaminopimelate desuccinylase
MDQIDRYLEEHRSAFERDLFEFLRIPSVSADAKFHDSVEQAAGWLAHRLERAGLAVQRIETSGNPLVYAESPAVEGKPVALVYGHYDVQPAQQEDGWETAPFEPVVRGGDVYARGATDDKGQLLTHVCSVESWLATHGSLPVQVKFLIEGEEEIGSPALHEYLVQCHDRFACHCVVVSDTSQLAPGRPAITVGLRGINYYELHLTGPATDLHSGSFGGAVTNPANTLCRMLASLADSNGRILVDGFYDEVETPTVELRDQLRRLEPDETEFCREIGAPGLSGEEGYSPLERRWIRPSYDVHGLVAGYQGEGAKTVLPCRASAKFSFRLVPRQDPARITENLRQHLARQVPAGIEWQLIDHHGSPAMVVPLDSPYLKAAVRAIESAFGRAPEPIREGGSIPVLSDLSRRLGADALLIGWGQGTDNAHGPNERFSLADFHRGSRASARLWKELARC